MTCLCICEKRGRSAIPCPCCDLKNCQVHHQTVADERMENTVKIEGLVHDYQDTVFAKTQTPVIIITLEHHRQGRTKVHTPWFRVFFIHDTYAPAKALTVGSRIKVTGSLDTTSHIEGNGEAKRRTYINGKGIEVVSAN